MTNVDMNVDRNETDTTGQTITAQKGHVQALAFARKGGKGLSELLGSIATQKETERKGPVQMFLFLETHYTDEEAIAIPVVGSKQGETGNKPYDKYTATVDTKDGKRKVPGSWFTDVVKATDEWQHCRERIDFCDDAALPGCPDDIANMGTGERAVEKERLRARIKDMRTALTRGAMLFHHVAEISQLNPERIRVKMPFRIRKDPETGENVTEVFGNMIRLQDPANEYEDKVFNVSQFTALKPDKIVGEKTIVSLEKTGDRVPKTKGKKGKQDIAVPANVEQLLNMLNILGTALDTETEQGNKLNAALLSATATPGDKGDDIVETIGDFALAIDSIWSSIDKRYQAIKVKKNQALNTRQAATVTTAAKMTA